MVTGTAAVPYVPTGKFSNSLRPNEPGPPSDEAVILAFTGDFPGSPVVKTACSQHRAQGLHPWLGN